MANDLLTVWQKSFYLDLTEPKFSINFSGLVF